MTKREKFINDWGHVGGRVVFDAREKLEKELDELLNESVPAETLVMPKIAEAIEKETKDYCQRSYWTSKYFADEEQCNEILQNQIKLFSRFIIETLNSNFTA